MLDKRHYLWSNLTTAGYWPINPMSFPRSYQLPDAAAKKIETTTGGVRYGERRFQESVVPLDERRAVEQSFRHRSDLGCLDDAQFAGAFEIGWGGVREVMAFGVVGGITTTIQGGKFGHGFKVGAFGAVLGGAVGERSALGRNLGNSGRAVARVVVAGTVSEISGGKFANGAVTAAFYGAAQSLFSSADISTLGGGSKYGPDSENSDLITFESLSKEERQLVWDYFDEHYESIVEAWDDNGIFSGPPLPSKDQPLTTRRVVKWFMRKGVGLAVDYMDWDSEKAVYELGLESFKQYRRFPPRGHQYNVRKYRDWSTVQWTKYDFGGSAVKTVDFFYWANDKGHLRPASCFIGDSC